MSLARYSINPDTIMTIGEFSILWCHFEQIFFNAESNPNKLFEWSNKQNTNDEKLIRLCACVKSESIKYLENTEMKTICTRIYSEANQGRPEHREQIYAFLNGDSLQIQFTGCMLYIQRIRNNFFHGLKGVYTLNDQKKMFDSINRLLYYILQR